MPFNIIWSSNAVKDIKKLDKNTVQTIIRKIENVSSSESPQLDKISHLDCFKIRAGDYRIFVDIDYQEDTLYILTVKHRKKAYK